MSEYPVTNVQAPLCPKDLSRISLKTRENIDICQPYFARLSEKPKQQTKVR
ncbi:MAG: hypothetical protein R2874_16825 [Desulfobacterales bacterium]